MIDDKDLEDILGPPIVPVVPMTLEEMRARPLFKPWTYAERKRVPDMPWLIGSSDNPVLISHGLWCTFGIFKSGKTYLSIMQAFCIATGTPYNGLAVQQGRVVYLCAEGDVGRITDRVIALCNVYGKDPDEVLAPGALNLIMSSVNLIETGGRLGVDTLLKSLLAEPGEPYVAVWLDTWSKMLAAGGGHDSDALSVMPAIMGCDRIRATLGCSVIIVAHVGYSESAQDRPKGLSDLPGQLDGATLCTKDGEGPGTAFTFTSKIQRYGTEGIAIESKMIELAPDRYLKFLTKRERAELKLTGSQVMMLALLKDLGPGATVDAWRDATLAARLWVVTKGKNKGEPIANVRAKWRAELTKLRSGAGWITISGDGTVTLNDLVAEEDDFGGG